MLVRSLLLLYSYYCSSLLYPAHNKQTNKQHTGIYEFTFQDGSKIKGRYSFVYTYDKGEWKIANHHSSIMPEGAVQALKKVAAIEKATMED